MATPEITVQNNPAQNRYDAFVDGAAAGFAAYRPAAGTVVFTHTEIDPAFGGKGVGSVLARAALDDVRSKGKQVVAQCPFIAAYIAKHPEYADLVVGAQRADLA